MAICDYYPISVSPYRSSLVVLALILLWSEQGVGTVARVVGVVLMTTTVIRPRRWSKALVQSNASCYFCCKRLVLNDSAMSAVSKMTWRYFVHTRSTTHNRYIFTRKWPYSSLISSSRSSLVSWKPKLRGSFEALPSWRHGRSYSRCSTLGGLTSLRFACSSDNGWRCPGLHPWRAVAWLPVSMAKGE